MIDSNRQQPAQNKPAQNKPAQNKPAQNKPTRVGVNLLWLVPGLVGGSENYITRLLHGVDRAAPPDIEIVLFALESFPDAHPDLTDRFTTVIAPIDGSNKPLRVLFESTWLAREARRNRVEVIHHAGGRMPLVNLVRSVLTIHDLQPLDMPENFSWLKRRFLARALPRSAKRAAIVVAPSEFVRNRIVERLRVQRARTAVVSAPLRDPSQVDPEPVSAFVDALIEPETPYFLYPAITYRHKNHTVLLEAFAQLRRARPDVRLVLTGGEGPEEATVRSLVAALGLDSSVTRTGRVARHDLDALIAHCAALVFPSRYEGFGLPVLEAMVAGRPVVVADTTAMPEVVDGVGALVGPDDVEGWAEAMTSVLDASAPDAEAMAAAARSRAERFSASRNVAELLDVYRRVV